MKMNTKEWAEYLDDSAYPMYIDQEGAVEDGVVVVHGYSDNVIEFDGAIDEELGVGDGDIIFVDGDERTVRHTITGDPKRSIKVRFFSPGDERTWAYETEIPHETFRVMLGGNLYCEGLVFYIEDVSVGETSDDVPWIPLSDSEKDCLLDLDQYSEARYFVRDIERLGFALCRKAPTREGSER